MNKFRQHLLDLQKKAPDAVLVFVVPLSSVKPTAHAITGGWTASIHDSDDRKLAECEAAAKLARTGVTGEEALKLLEQALT